MTRAFCRTNSLCQKLTSERYVSHEISLVKVILAKASPIERTLASIKIRLRKIVVWLLI